MGILYKVLVALLIGLFLLTGVYGVTPAREGVAQNGCDRMGWFPTDFGLKDHSVFWYDGYYYLVSNNIPDESKFAYGRSSDLCDWEDLGPILTERIPGTEDEAAVWAPFVWEEDGVFYMTYTGVSKGITQSIMLAISIDPSNPDSWQPHGLIFQPNHSGMVYQPGSWADCRDPMVLKIEEMYYLFYTGLDIGGGIVGMATAKSPFGLWQDWGSIIPPLPDNAMAESAIVVRFDENYYLFYHDTSLGEVYRIGASQSGPWGSAQTFIPGWAHELWRAPGGQWHTSYLLDYSVTISPLTWDQHFYPARPFIGSSVYHTLIPAVMRNVDESVH
jgi:predicted GH43/DUF377 family glycosyl hydrolase